MTDILWISLHPISDSQKQKLAQKGYNVVASVNHTWGDAPPTQDFVDLATLHKASTVIFAGVLPVDILADLLQGNKGVISFTHKLRGKPVTTDTATDDLVATLIRNDEVWNDVVEFPCPLWCLTTKKW